MAQTLARAPALAAILVLAHAVSAWPPVLAKYCATYAWRLDRVLFWQALRREPEDVFLDRKWPAYAVARLIERTVPRDGQVLTFNQIGEAYTSRPIRVVYQAAANAELGGILLTPLIPQYQPRRWLEFTVVPQRVRTVRVVQTAWSASDQFTVNELRVFHQGRERPPEPRWRLRASPFPWGVQNAFDGERLTFWGSWQTLQPGMLIEADFGQPEWIDRAGIEASYSETALRIKLEYEDAAGVVRTVAEPREFEIAPPLGMRRDATRIIKSRGVGYVLLHDDDYAAKDVKAGPERWGLTRLGEAQGYRLYAIR